MSQNPTQRSKLPSPQDRPGADVVVYDGECSFCLGQVKRLNRWDGGQRLSYLSLHDPRVKQLLPRVSHEQLLEQMYLVEPDGQFHGGAAAFRYLTRKLPRLWPLAPLMHIPGSMPLWQWLYRQIAARRYRLGRGKQVCDSGRCHVHFNGDRSAEPSQKE